MRLQMTLKNTLLIKKDEAALMLPAKPICSNLLNGGKKLNRPQRLLSTVKEVPVEVYTSNLFPELAAITFLRVGGSRGTEICCA